MDSPQEKSVLRTLYQCSVCLKSYKRREHLQRHQRSHTADRPHQCPVCAKAFQRTDVLQRHLRSCCDSVRSNQEPVSRRRACDRCVQQKKACNTSQPCQNCAKRGIRCLYSTQRDTSRAQDMLPFPLTTAPTPDISQLVDNRINEGPVNIEAGFFNCPDLALWQFPDQTWQDLLNFNRENGDVSTRIAERPYFFHFLDTFTSKTGFVSSFECGTLSQRQAVLDAFYHQQQREELGHRLTFQSNDQAYTPLYGTLSHWLNDPLAIQTHQILLIIKEVVTIRPRNSCVRILWSSEVEQQCVQFFSPVNLRKYIELYWAIWAPNVNFLHRPSFDAASSKPILLATMAIIGACVSPDEGDSRDVRLWLNCVEEAAFTDDDFNRDPVSPFQPTQDIPKLQALQAAYMVCLYQNWEGTDTSKKRIRRHRFGTVLSTVRDLDIMTGKHTNYNLQSKDEFEWKEFVAREELIRIFIWVFLMDTAFVTFNNLPPRMVAKEMKMQVAAPEACFQAPTADECYEEIQRWIPSTSLCWRASFFTVFERLCLEDLTEPMRQSVAALGPLNLFTIISGLHSLVFQYQSFFSAGHLLPRTHNALDNFKDIWHIHQTTCIGQLPHTTIDESFPAPTAMWRRVGFCRHAGDFWLLAKVKVDRLSAADALQNKSVISDSNGEDDNLDDPILNKYDQTSMRQVNDLISEFQKVHLGDLGYEMNAIP